MSAAVQPIHSPDTQAMRSHLEHLFGGYLDGCQDGLIELAWTDSRPDDGGRYRLKNASYYGTDQFEELIAEATRLNSTPMCNVYIGAALRRPETAPFGRSRDDDAYALTSGYVDLDDAGAASAAKDVYGDAGKPTMVVVTGREPHTRAQLWWRFDEPLTDSTKWPDLLRGMAKAMGGDVSVCNPGRVMRLAGTVAWPVKEGRTAIELTAIVPLQRPGQAVYSADHLSVMFPPVAAIAGNGIDTGGEVVRATNTLGIQTKVEDGRERYMVATIAACLIEYLGEVGATPEPQELFDLAWPQYERGADLTRAGRGKEEFARKCAYTVKRFEAGAIRGIETIDKAIDVYRRKAQAKAATPSPHIELAPPLDAEGKPLPLVLTPSQFMAGFTPPEYLWDGVLQRGYLYALTARTGHGKTAVTMQFGLHVAGGQPFHGQTVKQGTVLLLAGENPDDVRARFIVACHANGLDPAAVKMRFIAGVVDIAASMPVIRAEAETIADLVLVIVDTAAAYFKGDDSNSNSQQGDYARLLRQLSFLPGKPCVLVNCHPIKNAAKDNLLPMGGSAFVNEIDGNLTLWAGAEKQTTLHWQGKFRGPEFEPLTFEIVTVTCPSVTDAEGRLMPSVIAKPVTDMQIEHAESKDEREVRAVLNMVARNASLSLAKIVAGCNLSGKSRANRIADSLVADKLCKKMRGKLVITNEGKKYIGWDD